MRCLQSLFSASGLLALIATFSGVLCAQTSSPIQARVDSVTPAVATAGQRITVMGSGFGTMEGTLWAGTSRAKIVSWSDTQIVADILSTTASGTLAVLPQGNNQKWSTPTPFAITTPSTPDNGITVSDVKVYDDATLQQMLDNARVRLASMQFLDQTGIAARIGAMQGASLQQSGFALNVGGPPIPGMQTTANTGSTTTTQAQGLNTQANTGNSVATTSAGTNNQATSNTNAAGATTTGSQNTATTNNQLQVTGPSSVSTTSGSNQSQTVGPSTQTVTTLGQQNAATPALPSSTTFTLPSSFSPAATNLLNEQLELTYETTGLAMLLEGALSDHYVQVPADGGPVPLVRRRATIGVPVTLSPSKRYRDAVAEVILEITAAEHNPVAQPPAITAILPREKTYNVAAITDRSTSLGGAVVTHVMSVGANWLRGSKTYYVVQDQDTVAIQLPPDPNQLQTTRMGWQIRPVLGQKTVRSGTRTLFVQLAFPSMLNVPEFGSVVVITRWKKIDRKQNIVSPDPIPKSEVTLSRRFGIPNFDVTPSIQDDLEDPVDNGDGTVTVQLHSESYLVGTFIRIGTIALSSGSPNTLFNPSHINFTVPASLLATHPAYLVDRSGAYREITHPLVGRSRTPRCLTVGQVKANPVSSSAALVTVPVQLAAETSCRVGGTSLAELKLIGIVGNRVFGYRNDPLQSITPTEISFLAPLDLLRSSPYVTVKRMLWGPRFEAGTAFSISSAPVIDKAVLVAKSSVEIQIALMGSSLHGLRPVLPAAATLTNVTDTAALLVIPLNSAKDLVQVVLQGPSGDLQLVAMPSSGLGAGPSLQAHTPIKGGRATTISVQGSDLDSFEYVEFNKLKLKSKLSDDKKSITVELPASATVPPKTELVFFFKKSKPLTYSVEVFDTKVDLPSQQVPPR